jgi:hypothetical protein
VVTSRVRRAGVLYLFAQVACTAAAFWLSKHFDVARMAATAVALLPTVPGAYLAWAAYRDDRAGSAAEIAAKAADLAGMVLATETQQMSRLAGEGGKRIDLTFRHVPEPANNAAGADPDGRLSDILRYYEKLRPTRLVITGAPGAGKTVLALELLLANLDLDAPGPVPVRFSLAGWDAVSSLEDWLAQQITARFGFTANHARALVGQRRVLPVLDGLDEMDAPGTPVARRRASLAVKQLNEYQEHKVAKDSAPVILTCRTDQYKELARAEVRMRDAARVEIGPVGQDQAIVYLTARITNPDRWRPVLDALADRRSVLSRALTTPWRLNLAATVYEPGSRVVEGPVPDPGDLLTLASPAEVQEHLLARYVPAVLRQHPEGDRYSPQQTHRWLAEIATHLASPGTRASGGTDIALHELWPLSGPRRVRLMDGVFAALLWLGSLWTMEGMLTAFPRPGVITPPPIELFGVPTVWKALAPSVPAPRAAQLHRLRWRRQRRKLLRAVSLFLVAGLVAGVAGAFAVRLAFSCSLQLALGYGLAGGFVIGLALGLADGLTAPLAERTPTRNYVPSTDPRHPVRDDLVFGLAVAIIFGAALGLALAPAVGPAVGCSFGVAAGLMLGWYWLAGASRRYLVFLVCCRGRLPWKLGAFLQWAYEGGLLRMSGTAYQFRHRELQDWLASHPAPHGYPADED